jgi:ABC-type xylose transport system permease subunit
VIIMGEIDLAVGSMYGLSGTLVGFCMTVLKWKLLLRRLRADRLRGASAGASGAGDAL